MRHFMMIASLLMLAPGCTIPRFDYTRTVKQSVETQPLTSIDLSTFNGSIVVVSHVHPTVDMEIDFKAYGQTEEEAKRNSEQLDCAISAEGGLLTIKAVKPPEHWMSAVSFRLKVPEDCTLQLGTSNGKVSVCDMAAKVQAKTSNGAVSLKNIRDAIQASTSNGTVSVENCQGAIDLSTSNGKVTYTGMLVGKDNKIRTSNGRISLVLPATSLTEVSTRTSNGSIQCSLPTQRVLKEGKHEFHAIVGEGDVKNTEVMVTARTSNGSIRIEPLEVKDETGVEEPTTPDAEVGTGDSLAL